MAKKKERNRMQLYELLCFKSHISKTVCQETSTKEKAVAWSRIENYIKELNLHGLYK
jgi:hypothetical protein